MTTQAQRAEPEPTTTAIVHAVFSLEDDLTNIETYVKAIESVIDALERQPGTEHLAYLARQSHKKLAGHVEGLRRQWRALSDMTHDSAGSGAAPSVTAAEARLAGEIASDAGSLPLSPELRALVAEFGRGLLQNFFDAGVWRPGQIRHLISESRRTWIAKGGRP